MTTERKKYTTFGAELPTRDIFNDLRTRWLAVDDTRTSQQLATLLGQQKQHITNWARTRNAPWWAIMWLCDELGLSVVLTPESVKLIRTAALEEL
jgi:hypothetical protein